MTVIGFDLQDNCAVTLAQEARARGSYVIGATGTGKTTLLQSIAYQDMEAGHGVCVLDPHGDMIDWLLERVPPHRRDDVILFEPADIEHPFGLNMLECDRDDPIQVRWVVSTVVVTLRRLFSWSWGPLLEHVLSHTLWTAMGIEGSTLVEVLLLLMDQDYQEEKVAGIKEPLLSAFWKDFPTGSRQRRDLISSTVNKLTPFLLDEGMRNIVGQSKSTLNLRHIMDHRQILLVNLSKGDLGENNSSLLGSVLINLILMAALSRRDMLPEERQAAPFHVIVDEYQNFASESFSVLQSEARKYAVDLVVAHQFRDQLDDENKGSALNVGNFIAFRVTGVDSPDLAMQFDNTPPPPDPIWQPIRIESKQYPGYYQRGQLDQPAPGPRRLYSDVTLQTANELANLPPFEARARMIATEDDKLVLRENTVALFDPRNGGFPEYYGTSDPDIADYIWRRSKDMAPDKEEVVEEIRQRTGGRGMKNPPLVDYPPAEEPRDV